MAYTVGVDVGGTKVAAGVVDEAGTIAARARKQTPADDPDETETVIADVVQELRSSYDVEAVGVGAAGLVDEQRARVLFAPNLAWRDEPLRDQLEKRFGLPVVVENDANAAAWGESRFGAAQDDRFIVLVTVGTGIGGGIVLDDVLYRGRRGIAAEFGHMTLVPDGRRCGCGSRGCWEQYASGRALVREARDLATVLPATAEGLLELAGGRPEDITGRHVTAAAAAGDEAALEAFGAVGSALGEGMASLAAVLDPEVFLLGGGVSDAGDLLLQPVRERFLQMLTAREFREAPQVRLAELGGDAGIVGAADLARVR